MTLVLALSERKIQGVVKVAKTKNKLISFRHEQFGEIRTVEIDGEIWFVGKDVAGALGYSNPRKAIRDHVRDKHKRGERIVTPSGMQETTLINEPGLYSLVMRSKLLAAEKFQDWVYEEVLPSIRKTGSYSTVETKDERWLETRAHGIKSRKKETSAIKLFIEYARSQGCREEENKIYSRFSIWANKAAGIPLKGYRDKATVHELNIIDLIEDRLIQDELLNGMANQLHYTEIWAKIQLRIKAFVAITHQTPPLLNGT